MIVVSEERVFACARQPMACTTLSVDTPRVVATLESVTAEARGATSLASIEVNVNPNSDFRQLTLRAPDAESVTESDSWGATQDRSSSAVRSVAEWAPFVRKNFNLPES